MEDESDKIHRLVDELNEAIEYQEQPKVMMIGDPKTKEYHIIHASPSYSSSSRDKTKEELTAEKDNRNNVAFFRPDIYKRNKAKFGLRTNLKGRTKKSKAQRKANKKKRKQR